MCCERRHLEVMRVVLLGEFRAAPIRSEWAGALQRGRGTGGEVVRKSVGWIYSVNYT